jgi:hypothetical protein
MFERLISVDWSGAATEEKRVALRVATYDAQEKRTEIVNCPGRGRTYVNWTRQAFREWIGQQLCDDRPTLVAMDFGFGLPWRADDAVFQVKGWKSVVTAVAQRYQAAGTSRVAAEGINADVRFHGYGPYRFDDCRTDYRFYIDNEVAYYRQTELVAPQAISQWYLGSGGTVGFHTISGLAAIDGLMKRRDAGLCDFVVWPQETLQPDGKRHVLVESYPAICPLPTDFGPCLVKDSHQKDAWRVLQMLITRSVDGTLAELFHIREIPLGRYSGISFMEQVQFEGWIFGLR